jgi:tRNA1Val (adenine37-N6)-methyltransferase
VDFGSLDWPGDARSDRLIGDWHLWQRRDGHCTSTDDLLTAWFCSQRAPRPVNRYLDLGCGTASVLLMTAYILRPAVCVGIEAQTQSVQLATRTVAELPPGAPAIEIRSEDFRSTALAQDRFDVITGSPPYFPLGTGGLPSDAQRRACRFEERGGIEAYCETASHLLETNGRFYVVFQTTWDERVLSAATDAKLNLTARADVEARAGREPFLSVYEFAREPQEVVQQRFAVRDPAGEWTPEFKALRASMSYT